MDRQNGHSLIINLKADLASNVVRDGKIISVLISRRVNGWKRRMQSSFSVVLGGGINGPRLANAWERTDNAINNR